jgi:hypothetical protein
MLARAWSRAAWIANKPLSTEHTAIPQVDASINVTILRGWLGSIGFRAGFCLT